MNDFAKILDHINQLNEACADFVRLEGEIALALLDAADDSKEEAERLLCAEKARETLEVMQWFSDKFSLANHQRIEIERIILLLRYRLNVIEDQDPGSARGSAIIRALGTR